MISKSDSFDIAIISRISSIETISLILNQKFDILYTNITTSLTLAWPAAGHKLTSRCCRASVVIRPGLINP